MADFTDWESLDTELPEATVCEVVVKTSEGNKTLTDLGTPTLQEWTETDRNTTTITLTDEGSEYSITIERIDDIDFELDADTTKTMTLTFNGW
jgi:hypothetical protein